MRRRLTAQAEEDKAKGAELCLKREQVATQADTQVHEQGVTRGPWKSPWSLDGLGVDKVLPPPSSMRNNQKEDKVEGGNAQQNRQSCSPKNGREPAKEPCSN